MQTIGSIASNAMPGILFQELALEASEQPPEACPLLAVREMLQLQFPTASAASILFLRLLLSAMDKVHFAGRLSRVASAALK